MTPGSLLQARIFIIWNEEWHDMWVASGMPKLDFPGKAFIRFCQKRYQMKPNP